MEGPSAKRTWLKSCERSGKAHAAIRLVWPMGQARRVLVMTHHEAVQYERCLVFWARILRQAFDDLIALSNGYTVITDNGRRMPAAEREATLREVQEWFFVDSDAPASLAATCDHLDLSVGWIRGRARSIVNGAQAIQLRRHRLTAAQRAKCVNLLAAGANTRDCCKALSVVQSTIRKLRLRAEREGALKRRAV